MIWDKKRCEMKIKQNFFEDLRFFKSNINENYVDWKRIKKWIENWNEFFYKVENSLIMKSTKIENWADCENFSKIEDFR